MIWTKNFCLQVDQCGGDPVVCRTWPEMFDRFTVKASYSYTLGWCICWICRGVSCIIMYHHLRGVILAFPLLLWTQSDDCLLWVQFPHNSTHWCLNREILKDVYGRLVARLNSSFPIPLVPVPRTQGVLGPAASLAFPMEQHRLAWMAWVEGCSGRSQSSTDKYTTYRHCWLATATQPP